MTNPLQLFLIDQSKSVQNFAKLSRQRTLSQNCIQDYKEDFYELQYKTFSCKNRHALDQHCN